MRFSARAWALLSVLLFVAAMLFWRKGNEIEARKRLQRQQAPAPEVEQPAKPGAAFDPVSTKGAGLASLNPEPIKAGSLQNGKASAEQVKKRFPYRLQNTDKALNDLIKDDAAVLLANALIDTRGQLPEIPRHLKAAGDPGSYVVQWNRATDGEFRGLLRDAGAEIISYVPNNAYYVKIDKAGADRLAASPGVQAVMPFEPYYKLDMTLLRFAVEQEPLPAEAMLRLTLLPGSEVRGPVADEVRRLGGEVVAEEKSPFGPQLVVKPAAGSLVALAQLSEVQGIERAAQRKAAADLTRITLGISADGETNENYLGLTGDGTLVNINDFGIQPSHPTLADTTIHMPAGPLGPWLTGGDDPDGHGTFVASLIAGNGANSPSAFMTNVVPGTGTNTNSTTNIVAVLPGSTNNPSLRGMAPDADLLMLPLDATGGFAQINRHALDTWLIESAAETNYFALQRTNALISNNSWTYEIPSYDSSAARYDAAVRDALPGTVNDQPLLFVFAAGNMGAGEDDGTGGSLDTVESPGTAKNVITVGALEALRLITNVSLSFTNIEVFTNFDGTLLTNETVETVYPFAELTDSSTEVAAFSSRGNVGIGIEGEFGRFKPDVVAPGTMLVAARSAAWNFGGFDTNSDVGKLFVELNKNLQEYRFDSGSTFAAANISGLLALIQEYFRDKGPTSARLNLSPAMMKALVINGARPVGDYELAVRTAGNFQGWGLPNLPNSLSSYTTNDHSAVDPTKLHLRAIEQSASNAVVSGQGRTWNVTLSTNASVAPLRATLVWTDPPGNPAVGVKLVNDLDLVITNLDVTPPVVFYGNNFAVGGDVTEPSQLEADDLEPVDRVNNVENIVIRNPSEFGRRFSITVRGTRVNVNAIPNYLNATRSTNDVAQDFALVVSSDMGADPGLNSTNANGYLPDQTVFEEFTDAGFVNVGTRRGVIGMTNGLPLLEQRVGGNPPLVGTNGATAQWNFYVFTNVTVTNDLVNIRAGSNVAFVTFNPPNLSRPRTIEADIDLYVSTNPGLTNLVPSVVANSFKSRARGGTETVVFTNAVIGQIYYIGVKSEDQQAAEFSLIGISSDQPLEEDRNGRRLLRGVPLTAAILDGTARKPSAGTVIAIGLSNRRVANVSVLSSTFHENYPDLVGLLSHNQTRAILNNHTFLTNGGTFGTNTVYYNDNDMFPIPPDLVTYGPPLSSDGPGSLNDFAGQPLIGPWFLEMIDNSPSQTGRVELVEIYVDPLRDPILFGEIITDTIDPNQIAYYAIDVPPNATNLTFLFSGMTPGGQLEFYWQPNVLPTTNQFEFRTNIVAPGAQFSLPVVGGRTYFMGLRNPSLFPVTFSLLVTAQFADDSANRFFARSEVSPVPDAVTLEDVIDVNIDKLVADVQVGVRMKHPRTADIVLSLISPQGTRVLLAENRGYTNNTGFGSMTILTNGFTNGTPIIATQLNYVIFTERTNATVPVKYANPGGSVNLGTIGVPFASDFEGSVLAGNYNQGTTLASGWNVIDSPANTNTPSRISVINGLGLARTGDTLLSLGTAGIQRRFPITVGRPYRLKFWARAAKVLDLYSTGVSDLGTPVGGEALDLHYFLLDGDQTEFRGPAAYVLAPTEPPFTSGLWSPNSFESQWIAPYPRVPAPPTNGLGPYVFRTYIDMYEQDTRTAPIPTFRWSADDRGNIVRLNGIVLNYPSGSPTNLSGIYNLGGLIPGLNMVDFFVQETNGVEGLRVEVINGVQPVKRPATMRYVIGGVSRVTPALTPNWQLFDVSFVPTNALETVQFLTESGEVWVDTVSIETSGDIYLQPEEPFDLLDGERAMGEWTLEVRDSRTGVVLPTSEVLEWTLDLTLAEPTNPATLVRNGHLDFYELRTNQVHWVILDPCRSASFARLTITGIGNFDEIEMRADWSGFPSGDPEKEDFFPVSNDQGPSSNGQIVFEINRSLPAPAAMRGKPLYIAIYNRFLDATNSYSIDFISDGDCAPLTPPPTVPPGGPGTPGTLPPNTGGGGTNSNAGLVQFNVGSGIRSATVTVVSDQDVSVYALKDEPPTTSVFSHFVDDVNTAGTEVMVIRNADGSELVPGTWFVRVGNDTTNSVNYTVSVTFEYVNAPADIRLFLFPLTGGGLRLQWNSVIGVSYIVEGADAVTGPWTTLTTVTATSPTSSFTIDPSTPAMRFYRVRQAP